MRPDRSELMEQALLWHRAALRQLDRVREMHAISMAEIKDHDTKTDGEPASSPGVRRDFNADMVFLFVAVHQLDKALRLLGFAGFPKGLGDDITNLRDWYTHYEDPQGRAYSQYRDRNGAADISAIFFEPADVHFGHRVALAEIATALGDAGKHLPRYEALVLHEASDTPTHS